MKRLLQALLLPIAFLCTLDAAAQGGLRDTSIMILTIDMSIGYQSPSGNLAERFGSNGNLGGGMRWKLRNNFIFGAQASFLFGSKVKETVANGVRTDEGYFIDAEGEFAEVLFLERGLTVVGTVGKIFPIVGPNPNSGLLVQLGAGMLQHKIRIEARNNDVPAIEGENAKGYDKLSNGFTAHQSVGYQWYGNNKLVNLYFGFEAFQSFTESRREYDFDLMAKDETKRKDSLYGIKLIWSFPIYKRDNRTMYFD